MGNGGAGCTGNGGAFVSRSSKDVTPVKHGEWIDSPDGTTTICSYCKADWDVFDNDTYRFNYCPHCGAKMDLGE